MELSSRVIRDIPHCNVASCIHLIIFSVLQVFVSTFSTNDTNICPVLISLKGQTTEGTLPHAVSCNSN